jgi:hypothetical protein
MLYSCPIALTPPSSDPLTQLDFVIQGHRHNVIEDLGPMGSTYNVTLAFPLFYIWEPLICFISAIYCALTIIYFVKKRVELNKMFEDQSSRVTKSSYVRIIGLCAVGIAVHLPISFTLVLGNGIFSTIYPWISWEDTHSNFGQIAYINRTIVDMDNWRRVKIQTAMSFCFITLSGILYFAFFGTGKEAFGYYTSFSGWLLKPLRIRIFGIREHRTGTGAGNEGGEGANGMESKPANHFGIFPRRDTRSGSTFARMPTETTQQSTLRTNPLSTYLSNMFSSFGTLRSDEVGTRFGAVDTQMSQLSRVTEATRTTRRDSQPFDKRQSISGIPARHNSSISDSSEKIREEDVGMDTVNRPTVTFVNHDQNQDQNQKQEPAQDLEAGVSADTAAAVAVARSQFELDNPELTEQITF